MKRVEHYPFRPSEFGCEDPRLAEAARVERNMGPEFGWSRLTIVLGTILCGAVGWATGGWFFAVLALVLGALCLRQEIVCEYYERAMDWAMEQEDWVRASAVVRSHGYDSLMWDFRKWTFEQFYPGLERVI